MNEVFADAGYYIALLNPRDARRERALELSKSIHQSREITVTSELMLVEVADYFAAFGSRFRQGISGAVRALLGDPNTDVVPFSSTLFDRALELYSQRADKDWGLADCASFVIMQDRGIATALAHDRHFEQAGFKALLRDE